MASRGVSTPGRRSNSTNSCAPMPCAKIANCGRRIPGPPRCRRILPVGLFGQPSHSLIENRTESPRVHHPDRREHLALAPLEARVSLTRWAVCSRSSCVRTAKWPGRCATAAGLRQARLTRESDTSRKRIRAEVGSIKSSKRRGRSHRDPDAVRSDNEIDAAEDQPPDRHRRRQRRAGLRGGRLLELGAHQRHPKRSRGLTEEGPE